jgi:hypothetical protein
MLNGKDREIHMLHAFLGPVVEIDVREFDLTMEAFYIDTIIVVLGCDLDLAGR